MKTKGRRICRAIGCFLLIGALLATSYLPGLGAREAVSAAQTAISQTEASLIRGQSVQLAVNGTKKKVTWSTSDKKVASVDQTGYVVAKKAGKAVIKAKIGKKTLTCKVTVAAEGLNTADRTV